MVRPTMCSPRRCRSPATTELSTPPDMATAVVMGLESGTGIGWRQFAELGGGFGDGVDQGVDLFGRVRSAERESQAGAGAFARESNGEEDVRRLDCAAGAGGTAGDGESFEVERDDQGFAFEPVEVDVSGVGSTGGAAGVDAGVGDTIEDALFEAIAEGAEAVGFRGEFFGGGGCGLAEGDPAGDVFGARAALAFVASAVLNGLKLGGLADEERADAFRSVELVAAERVKIDAGGAGVDGDFSGGLDAVGMERDFRFAGDGGNFGERLDGAELVVCVHHRDENRFRAQRAADVVGIDR